MKTLSLTILAALAFFPAAQPMFGDVIVSDTLGVSTGSENAFLAVSWTQTGTFDNVSIKAGLESNSPLQSTGTAYLSDKLGPGATNGDVLDTFAVSTNNNTPSTMIALFSGLTLGPGTYYLSINPGSGLFWVESGTPVQTLGSGVTQGSDKMSSGAIGTPPISTSFVTSNVHQAFQVTGDPVATVTGTPEPSMIGFMSAGLGLVVFARRLRNRSRAV
jgi:hypothetical protein